jgi:hypothetical protein
MGGLLGSQLQRNNLGKLVVSDLPCKKGKKQKKKITNQQQKKQRLFSSHLPE